MLKKLLSRRGFTIVEVMVAFVIFSIMAAMVATILNTTMQSKQENNKLEQEIAEQKSKYYLSTQDKEYKDKTVDGSIDLNFSSSGGGNVSIDYSVGNPNKPDDDNEIELDYCIGHLKTKFTEDDMKDNGGNSSTGSVTSRLDSRIYGSSGIDDITIKAKYLGEATGGYRYMFEVLPSTSTLIGSQYEFHAQFKMKFPSNTSIVDYGYIDNIQVNNPKPINKSEGYNKEINITVASKSVVTIGSRMPKYDATNPSSMFTHSDYKQFWVTLSSPIDISDLNKIFGTSATNQTSNKSGDTYKFEPYRESVKSGEEGDKDDAGTLTHPNIFGAFPNEEEPETPAETGEATSEA